MRGQVTAAEGSALLSLTVDAATARMVELLRAGGIPSLLLKGGALRAWLYDDGTARAYGDIDLLVNPHDFVSATALLIERGWTPSLYPSLTGHADHFRAPDGDVQIPLDLHRSFHFVTVEPARAWALLSAHAAPMRLGGREIATLDEVGLATIVALHHVRHGRERKHTEDLERAVARASLAVWDEAATLAGELGALAAFSAGLRDVDGGRAVADALGLPASRDAMLALSLASPPIASEALLHLHEARRSPLELLRVLAAELAPSPLRMREHYPLARRGRAGLLLAYLLRPARLARHLRAGARAAAAARRAVSEATDALADPVPLGAFARLRLSAEIIATFVSVRRAGRAPDVRVVLRDLRDARLAGSTQPAAQQDATAARLARATQRVLCLVPADTRCLNQSLVLCALLARRGISGRLVIGVRNPDATFDAHAWVELDGRPLLPPGVEGHVRLVEL